MPFTSVHSSILRLLSALFVALAATGSLQAADPASVEKQFLRGEYEETVEAAKQALTERFAREEWSVLLTKSLLTLGRYPEAQVAIMSAIARHPRSLRVRLLAREVFLANGQVQRATDLLDEINLLGGSRLGANRDAPGLVALGDAALVLGADAKLVLENFYRQARELDPKYRESYLAIGKLALEKYDDDLASKTFGEALQHFPDDPDVHWGLARAFASSDRSQLVEHIEAALKANPKHIPSLLLLADHLIDAEEYQEAEKTVAKILDINPAHPEAWAYRAVMAHLRADYAGEERARTRALQFWATNPLVDHLIGKKLSQKYRFAEGAARQRKALEFDPNFLLAKLQLAQDLLRLGEETEGWKLAEEVHKRDAYDVVAYNLVTLNDNIAKFQLLTNDSFIVRMHPHEAAIYGDRVLDLLNRAKERLCNKYAFTIDRRIYIEIFPEQKDFAVRTFGMPGGEGFLGVCFGPVVTANSPASQTANPSNWEAVLWHEFCHVITLGLTKNKMPRWLSEGISVYEERQANPAWGQTMNPEYRRMVLGEDLVPISELSGAFLTPKSPLHLQFAYYESSLVVEFLIDRFGLDALKKILHDLGEGKPINPAIEAHTAPMADLEKEFADYARGLARKLGPELDWTQPDDHGGIVAGIASRLASPNPKNYYVMVEKATTLLREKKWDEAKEVATTLLELFPENIGPNNPYEMLAVIYRELGQPEKEMEVLSRLATRSADAVDAYLRLMELGETKANWPVVRENAERFLAVNPLIAAPHRYRARASEALGETSEAIYSYKKLLRLNPADPTDVHYRLAKLLHTEGDPAAKRHLLQSLEEAPRFREALDLLLTLRAEEPKQEQAPDPLVAPTSPSAPNSSETVTPPEEKSEPLERQ